MPRDDPLKHTLGVSTPLTAGRRKCLHASSRGATIGPRAQENKCNHGPPILSFGRTCLRVTRNSSREAVVIMASGRGPRKRSIVPPMREILDNRGVAVPVADVVEQRHCWSQDSLGGLTATGEWGFPSRRRACSQCMARADNTVSAPVACDGREIRM